MSKQVKIPDPLYEEAAEVADERDITIGAVIDQWHREATAWHERRSDCL